MTAGCGKMRVSAPGAVTRITWSGSFVLHLLAHGAPCTHTRPPTHTHGEIMAPWSGCARTAVERHPESRTNCVCVCVCVCVRARARVCVGVMCLRVVLGRVHASSLPPRHRRTDAQDGHDPHTGAARELTVTFAHPGTSSHSRKRCMCVCVSK